MNNLRQFKEFLCDLKTNQEKSFYNQEQLWASQKLNALFSQGHFIPQTTWSMNPMAMLHALNISSGMQAQSIVEFGSGATTLYLAQQLKLENRKTPFISIESNKEWKILIEKQLAIYDLQDYVQLVLAPVVPITKDYAYENQETWYDQNIVNQAVKAVNQIDLIIVDGPFGGSTPYARYSAYPVLKDKTHSKSVWLLDDTNRSEEAEISKAWQKESGLEVKNFKRYSILQHRSVFDLTPYRFN